ncbi:hypothetical protein [Montanilutibacter psychrotolerans]|uniref:Uncharacterized protein n=1 Tax=Montanilutibacter psychrotolerans TaxID=1327343 RepID=A0A3M8SKB6_9GAMM|nr:hypothetical protein [Lysobacter psychrotolerans]RNF81731.1 hypothetical protein EER27_16590 [Lysobacter psychrotolerans]
MNDTQGYAVFLFPQAIEALGDAVKPYLVEGPVGPHLLCREIDTGGALVEMTIDGVTAQGQPLSLELMIPTQMVRMIVSARGDLATFGFAPRGVVAKVAVASATGPADAPTETAPDAEPSSDSAPAKP